MVDIELPIVVSSPNDILVFKSISDLVAYLEPIDIENHMYKACYDSKGRLLGLFVKNDAHNHSRLIVELMEDTPQHLEELMGVLQKFLFAVGVDQTWLSQASLEQLIFRAIEHQ